MFNVILVEPGVPPNTGNVIRLCANAGARLHLIEPLGFPLEDARVHRVGLDCHEYTTMRMHVSWDAFLHGTQPDPTRTFALTTRGSTPFASVAFQPDDQFIFGSETRGLPEERRKWSLASQRIHLPTRPDNRSLNLSNTVVMVMFEARRQNGFAGDAWA